MSLLSLVLVVSLFSSLAAAKEKSFEYGASPEDGGLSFLGLANAKSPETNTDKEKSLEGNATKSDGVFLEIALESYEVQTMDGFSTTIAWGTPLYLIAQSVERGLKKAYPATNLTFQGDLTPAGEVAEQALHEVLSAIETKCQPYAGTLFTEYFSDWSQRAADKIATGRSFSKRAFLFPNDFNTLAEAAIEVIFHSTGRELKVDDYPGIPPKRQKVIKKLDTTSRNRVLDEEFHKFRYYLSICEFMGAYAKHFGGQKRRQALLVAKPTWKRAHDAYLFIKEFRDFKPVR
mgnify:CR=1